MRHFDGPLPTAGPVEYQRTREEFFNLIAATPSEQFEKLTEEIPAMMAAASLTPAACDQLFRAIYDRTRASVKSIKHAYNAAKSNTEGQDAVESMHLIIANKVIRDCYDDGHSIAFSDQGMRAWNGSYWDLVNERSVYKQIHDAALALAVGDQLTDNTVRSIYALIKTETFKAIEFDKPANFINVANGEVHLIDGGWMLFPARRENYRTTQIPVAYDHAALAPVFDAFLDELFKTDPDIDEKAQCLLEMMGYTLTTQTNLEKYIMLVGHGANGKSVVFGIMKALLGPKAIAAVQPSQFENTFKVAHLMGKLANVVTELQRGEKLKDGTMKLLVSGDMITAEKKYMDPFDFSNHATMWLGCNELPGVGDFSDALFRRTIILEFNQVFGEKGRPISATSTRLATANANPELRKIERGEGPLAAELPGILNMALDALRGLLARGGRFTTVASSEARIRKWHHEHDTVAAFIGAKCVVGGEHSCGSTELYMAYKMWASSVGIDHPVTHTKFVRRVKDDYDAKTARKMNQNDIHGIGLKVSEAAWTPTPAPYVPHAGPSGSSTVNHETLKTWRVWRDGGFFATLLI